MEDDDEGLVQGMSRGGALSSSTVRENIIAHTETMMSRLVFSYMYKGLLVIYKGLLVIDNCLTSYLQGFTS